MLDMLQEYWGRILGTGGVSAVLGWIGVDTIRAVRRHEREKADRTELSALVKKVEDGHTALLTRIDESSDRLMARIDASNAEGGKSRKALHEKIEGYMRDQNRINLDVAKYMRRNGHHEET